MGRPAKEKTPKGAIPQHAAIDLAFDLSGVEALWTNRNKEVLWRGWLPSLDLAVSQRWTAGSAHHHALWKLMERLGELTLRTQLNLTDMLRPAVQPGSKIDFDLPAEKVILGYAVFGGVDVRAPSAATIEKTRVTTGQHGWLTFNPVRGQADPFELTLHVIPEADIKVWSATNESKKARPLQLHRALLPWADTKADIGKPVEIARAKELDGGSWARGRKLFFSDTATCSKCHSVHGQGAQIGPDLTNLVHRDYPSVYRDITNPSFAINPDYITQTVTLNDDRVLTGVVRTEGGKLHIGDKDGKVTIVEKAEIATMRPAAISIMPDDLVRKLGPEHTRDLLTFLLTPAPSMPRDYVGAEHRPKPRTVAEIDAVLAGAPNPPAKTRPLFVVLAAGPKDHGPGEHDYPAWQRAWMELLAAGDNIEVMSAWEWPTKEQFQKADAMIFFQHGTWDGKRAADIDAFLERGGGLSYIHWAVDGGKEAPAFAKRIGLAAGPPGIKFRHGPLELQFNRDNRHPIARNLDKLKMVDESYWKMTGTLSKERVIAWQTEDQEPQPLFWSLEHGKGRVFVSIPGHYSWSFDDPLFRVLLFRGLAWSAKEPVDRFNDLVWPGADVVR
jgi:putative heme-binding domain-containing protein